MEAKNREVFMPLRKMYAALCQASGEAVPLKEAARLLSRATGMSYLVVECLLRYDGVEE